MSQDPVERARAHVDAVYLADSRRVLATLIRLLGDFDIAEEAMQEAFAAAVEQWPRDGTPANPRAWLVSTGRFKAIDAIRRRARFDASQTELAERLAAEASVSEPRDPGEIEDDRLRLIFTCCHPALSLDLRGRPAVERGFPPLLGAAVAFGAAASVLLALFPGLDAALLRGAIRAVSGDLWLLLLGASWLVFGWGAFHLFELALALTHDELVRAHRGPGPRRRWLEILCHFGWIAGILAAWSLLPPSAAVGIHAACLGAAYLALGLPGGPDVPLLWRARGRRARSTSWRTHTLAQTAWVGILLADAVLLVNAGDFRGAGRDAAGVLPFTAGLASLFAWAGAAALLAWCHLVVRTAALARFRDPSRPGPVPVFVPDPPGPGERRRLRALLEGNGFRVRFAPARPGPLDAVVSFRETDGPVEGALRVPPGEAGSAESLRRIRRRHEVRCRRALLRGLEGLFRRAAARRFRRGIGFWVAPWHWFCLGLSRDEDERTVDWKEGTFFLETVGPSYHRVFPRGALAHAHAVMRDLEVDLVFVEDGVGFRRLRRVLRMAFEVHDMLGPRGRAEERHFSGLPGVRVLLHEYTMEEPFRARRGGYPEPDYETVGRARILHVFRDRGEETSPADVPSDRRGVPLLT